MDSYTLTVANNFGMIMTFGCIIMIVSGLGGLVTWWILHRDSLR